MNVSEINHVHFKKIHKKNIHILENLDGIFLEQATSKRSGNKEHQNGYCNLSSPKMGESSF